MGMQDGAGLRGLRQNHVQKSFGRWLRPGFGETLPLVINEDKLAGFQAALVESTGGNQQPQGSARGHDAVVAARAERPAAAMKIAAGLDQLLNPPRAVFGCAFLPHGVFPKAFSSKAFSRTVNGKVVASSWAAGVIFFQDFCRTPIIFASGVLA